jgi:hypothetical protein
VTRPLALLAAALVVVAAPRARAEAPEKEADALFESGKRLRDAGQYADACPRFAQSKHLAPGVGISLHLADCYEHIGRTASAWAEFREAEKLAQKLKDKRAAIAGARARALEPKLKMLIVDLLPADRTQAGVELHIDSARVPLEEWNVALAVDPGDHTVSLSAPGREPRTFRAHVDDATPVVTVRTASDGPGTAAGPAATDIASGAAESAGVPGSAPADAPGSLPPAVADAPGAAAATPTAIAVPGEGPKSVEGPKTEAPKTDWPATALVGVGFLGVGVGAALLTASGSGPQDPTGSAVSAFAFGVGGAAFVSAFVVHFVLPRGKQAAVLAAPTPVPGGAAASLYGVF